MGRIKYDFDQNGHKYMFCRQQTDGIHDYHWPFTRHYNQKGIIDVKKVIEAIEESSVKEEMLILEIIHPFEAKEDDVIEDFIETCRYWRKYL